MWVARRGRVHQLSSLSLLPSCTAQSQQLREAHRGPHRGDEALADKVRRCAVLCLHASLLLAALIHSLSVCRT
jgi:hypothetical protein